MLLICLLVAAQSPGVRPQYDLANYLAVATAYRSPNRALARREIREWRSGEIEAALRALRGEGDRLRTVAVHAGDIDFRTVEAAVLLHADVGLASLQAMSFAEAVSLPTQCPERGFDLGHPPLADLAPRQAAIGRAVGGGDGEVVRKVVLRPDPGGLGGDEQGGGEEGAHRSRASVQTRSRAALARPGGPKR